MTEESKEEVKELTTEQKLDALMNGVVANNDLLTRLVAGLDAIVPVISNMLTPQQPSGPTYPQGYPVQPPQTPPNPQTTPPAPLPSLSTNGYVTFLTVKQKMKAGCSTTKSRKISRKTPPY